jgi:hypothetical protein
MAKVRILLPKPSFLQAFPNLSKEPPSKLGGIQDLEMQFELFGIMLMFDISTNHLSRDVVPYTADNIAIVPQLSTPQLLLHLRKLLKNHASRNTFQPLHNLSRAIARWGRKKYMYMIVQDFLDINFKSIPLGNLLKILFNRRATRSPKTIRRYLGTHTI